MTTRSAAFRLSAFSSVLATKGIEFFSLQKDEAASQAVQFAGTVRDLMSHCEDLLDTAALILNLDLVITVDTVVAHLAGALNKPVWLLNRHGSEWRWGVQGESTPWYPSMRVFRQSAPGDWQAVLDAVAERLRQLTSGGVPA